MKRIDLPLNDVHSGLNETQPLEVLAPSTVEHLSSALERAAEEALPVIPFGGRHAMGGQQFLSKGLCLDLTGLRRLLAFDRDRGLLRFEAGAMWPEVVQATQDSPWAIRQKQTGADDLTLGGSLSANIHGRGLTLAPFISDVETFTLLDATGRTVRCSRTENSQLFSLAAGGYGLFGPVVDITLRLTRRQTLRRHVRVIGAEELLPAFQAAIHGGASYGDWQFAVDPARPDFLRRGVFSCYEPVAESAAPEPGDPLDRETWRRLLRLACTQPTEAFEQYASQYLRTDGRSYASDLVQMSTYLPDYAAEVQAAMGSARPATLMITELYVPRERLPDFLEAVAGYLRARGERVIYGTVRLIERDTESFLPWAREAWACVVMNLLVIHEPQRLARLADSFRGLIDLALERGGSFYLTYHRHATRDQLLAAYPQMPGFLDHKRAFDPGNRFQSDWYVCLQEKLGGHRNDLNRSFVGHVSTAAAAR